MRSRFLRFGVLVTLLGTVGFGRHDAATPASAIAFDKKTGAIGWAAGHATQEIAAGAAMGRCIGGSGKECAVVLQCSNGGYGAIYRRYVVPVDTSKKPEPGEKQNAKKKTRSLPQLGFSCGAGSAIAANDEARYRCELQVAIALGGLPKGSEATRFEWSFVLQRLRQVCPGLGNCRCGERVAAWFDAVGSEQS